MASQRIQVPDVEPIATALDDWRACGWRTCVGQQVEVHVDSYPGKTFQGTVASVSPGTGSQFSLLPAENATGNWVKVVQRLPVRIELKNVDPGEYPLHGGLSATVNVDTQFERHLFSADAPRRANSELAAAQ